MTDVLKQYEANTARGPYHIETDQLPHDAPASYRVKPIAFYLPQFHAIPENDSWWGRGFTEWTNVTKAMPRYAGHLQPRLPADLGFYDLTDPQTLHRQAELVRRSGVYGLCFHNYWFGGRRLLEKPLDLLLANSDIDMRFCLNWANESWSRRWDGSDTDVLMPQVYDPNASDAYARSILPAVRDPRYIRIDDRPLVLVYRPGLIPDAAGVFDSWRELFRTEGENDPYLVMVQSFDDFDPRPYGLDAAAGFPPHNAGIWERNDRKRLRWLDRDYIGHARSYSSLAARMMANRPTDYRLFPGVCPSWDNEARKPRRGASFYGSNPAAFETWLENAAAEAGKAPEAERLVFINAWNEWAEGAILEPDRHYGAANLMAVRNVVDRTADRFDARHRSMGDDVGSSLNVLRNLPRRAARRLRRVIGA